ncbi:lipoprotein, putative [Pseudooceanicola batsensis HTCC2597]|uniref:Lipoprotein, putative n=1 Tax=Pseudooceanicola batsensis (strain ATCC BAA-863 / DSM 15984 / KCTC 12145 / HTCC2597) TaxID=252305 RepID=A3TYQ1_PSEBH|nr:DUF2927 domain-containing protein [Pseudooceanicola batsensis]EAQ02719.1 lipoprotein, putative [Pseudooceanicola batsensis HTCC2597]
MMMTRRLLSAMAALAMLAGCDMIDQPSTLKPQARPAAAVSPPPPEPPERSPGSRALGTYYAAFQADLLAQGLLRTDGGGIDTPFTARELAENFEQIVFYDEYVRGGGLRGSGGAPARLRRWPGPVRIAVEFGPSVPEAIRATDGATVREYTTRLARLTGHPISLTPARPNFHVLVMGEDDRDHVVRRVRQLVPDISATSLSIFQRLPRAIHCLVVAFSQDGGAHSYARAIALVRAEHPDLVRQSCYHEEMAQGLGLANDSPRARPSIFNDDDEFALLTTHDEMLLKMLYDPRLSPGMSADEARPIVRDLARELVGGEG